MKSYPEIQGPNKAPKLPCIAFEKYDGSNLRFEFSKKRGWYKFGTRNRLFDASDEVFGEAIDIFNKTYANDLEKVIRDNYRDTQSVIVFCEFFGPSSFAGLHKKDEPKELMLFDVNLHKKGLIPPKEFVKTFSHLKVAKVIYSGNLNEQFIEDVRNGVYPVNEGVVCKGGSDHSELWMCKVKTHAYLEKLKALYKNDWKAYWE